MESMKKLLFISSLLWSVAHAQTIPGYATINARYYWLSGAFRGLNIPAGGTAALYSGQWVKAGALFYDSTGANKGLYVWDGSTWTLQGESKTFRQGVYDSSGIVGIGAGVKNKSVFTTDRRINTNGFEIYLDSRSTYLLLGADSSVAGGAAYIDLRGPYGGAINLKSDTSARTTNAIQWEKQGVLQAVIGNDIGPSTHHFFIDLYGTTSSVNLEAGGTAFAQFGVAAQYLALTAGGRLNIGSSGTIGGQTANVIGTLSASDSVLFTNIARVTDTTGFDVVMMNRTTGNHKKIYAGLIGGVGAAGLTVGTTTITSGTTTRVLYDNAGVLGEYAVSGSGNVAMTTSPTFTTPALGTPSALVLTNATGLPVAGGGTGLGTLTANYIPRGNGTSAFTNGADLTFDNNIFKVKAASGISNVRIEYSGGTTIYQDLKIDGSGNSIFNSQGSDLIIQRSAANIMNIAASSISILAGVGLAIAAGTTTVSPLKLTTGTNLTTATAGSFEYATPQLFFTNGGAQRQEIPLIQQTRVSTQFDATSTTTLANVTGLTATLVAGKKYRFDAILFTTSNVAGGVKVAIGGTVTATAIVYEGLTTDAGGTTQSRGTTMAATVGAQTAATNAYIKISGTITVNAAGTLTVQFAQNTSNGAASSVLVGSTFETTEIL